MQPQMNADERRFSGEIRATNHESRVTSDDSIHNQFDISLAILHTGTPCEWNAA